MLEFLFTDQYLGVLIPHTARALFKIQIHMLLVTFYIDFVYMYSKPCLASATANKALDGNQTDNWLRQAIFPFNRISRFFCVTVWGRLIFKQEIYILITSEKSGKKILNDSE